MMMSQGLRDPTACKGEKYSICQVTKMVIAIKVGMVSNKVAKWSYWMYEINILCFVLKQ
mgnify:CR=1 FL=1